jgi:hypothetical protein
MPGTAILTLMRTRGIITVVVFCLITSGCLSYQSPANPHSGFQDALKPVTPVGSSPVSTGPPLVFIITPPFDGGILAGNVTIFVEVSNFILVPEEKENKPGTGHLIYYRDVVPPALRGVPAFTMPDTYGVSHITTFEWDGITPGTHTFAVQLVNADNTPLDPPVIDAIDVTAVTPEMIANP